MRIGEFAKICNTKISVLRHYDKQNLLKPMYIDDFSGYRYYSNEQIFAFFRITALKQAGFSLGEIREILASVKCDADVLDIFERKKLQLQETLHNLEEAKKIMIGAENMKNIILMENTDLPFINDEDVIGKWEAVGEYAVKEDFLEGKECRQNWYYEYPSILYFLPEGEQYWCFSWTKGKLIVQTGDTAFVNDYQVEQIGDEKYMFVAYKGYDYRRGGGPKILVLRQVDKERHSAKELARKDDIDMPFVPDERILGTWKVFDFIQTKEEFSPEGSGEAPIFFKEIRFTEGGHCTSIYGEEVISGDEKQVWTKGYVLRKWNSCACAYEIREVDGREYLIIEWKSGDYRWGGFPTDYYVFVRG